MNVPPEVFCMIVIGLTMVLQSWYDCGSDHDEGTKLTYPGEKESEVN